jgi:hypothetical protein
MSLDKPWINYAEREKKRDPLAHFALLAAMSGQLVALHAEFKDRDDVKLAALEAFVEQWKNVWDEYRSA